MSAVKALFCALHGCFITSDFVVRRGRPSSYDTQSASGLLRSTTHLGAPAGCQPLAGRHPLALLSPPAPPSLQGPDIFAPLLLSPPSLLLHLCRRPTPHCNTGLLRAGHADPYWTKMEKGWKKLLFKRLSHRDLPTLKMLNHCLLTYAADPTKFEWN